VTGAPAPAFTIRAAVASDAAEIARLLTALGHATDTEEVAGRWPAWSAAGNGALVAVAPGGGLAGLATLHQTHVLHRPRPVGRITALVIDPSVLLEITCHMRRTDAHRFYERIGYEKTSLRFAKTIGPRERQGAAPGENATRRG
jgi:hypothetical protein